MKKLSGNKEFERVLKLKKAIIYFQVNWSGTESISRELLFNTLSKMNDNEIPIFIINCSTPENQFIEKWLINQKKDKNCFVFGGFGETIFFSNGQIKDFILNPSRLGIQKIKDKITEWQNK